MKKVYTGKKRGRKCKSLNPPLTIAEYEAAKLSNQLIQQQQGSLSTQNIEQQPVKMLNSSKKLHTLILNRTNEQQVYKMEIKRYIS